MTRLNAAWLEDPAAQRVCAVLTPEGYAAFFVGGCVRNALLGEPVTDLDIATDARPDVVMALADAAGMNAIPTGIAHGTVTVVANGQPFEITTFRRDVATDGRHAVVAFSDSIEEDARRRDFTMNALYADPTGLVHDPLSGMEDLRQRRVRFIENAHRRIAEDYLRILRFFRFHAWYGADGIDRDGLAACAELADGIETLSKERIGQEMLKLLAAPDPAPALTSMSAAGVLHRVLPGADPAAIAPLVHLEQQCDVPPDPIRRLAALGGEDRTGRLRLSNAQVKRLEVLDRSGVPLAETAYREGIDVARDQLLIEAASTGSSVEEKTLIRLKSAAERRFPLTAADLMPGLSGPALGEALAEAERRWIDSGFTLGKDDLLA